MTSQTGQKLLAIHILPNISRNNINQTMKFRRLLQNSVINICLKKLCRKLDRETTSKSFLFK